MITITNINLLLFEKSFNVIIKGLKHKLIKKLSLTSTSINDEQAIRLANELPNSTLSQLALVNAFNNVEILTLANALETNTTITYLWLSRVNVDIEGAIRLGRALATNRTLIRLTVKHFIDNQNIARAFATEFARILSISLNTTLKDLDFSYNKLGDEGFKTLVEALSMTKISYLNLDGNEIGAEAEGLTEVVEILSNTTIERLDLFDNLIGDDVAKVFAEVLRTNRTLTILDFTQNKISDEGATALASALTQNTTLNNLELNGNPINDNGYKALKEAIEKKINEPFININFKNLSL